MTDPFKARTLKRKNVKGLALNATPNPAASSEGDRQVPGAIGNSDRTDTLEIGLEFRLDLRSEDLIALKELGAGNGGTVCKVKHASTNVVMARKVRLYLHSPLMNLLLIPVFARNRLSASKPKRRYARKSYENFGLDTIATSPTLLLSMVHSRTKQGTLCCAWNTWISGRFIHVVIGENKADIPLALLIVFPRTSDRCGSMF